MIIQPGKFSTTSLRNLPRGDDICQILAAALNSADAGAAIGDAVSMHGDLLVVADHTYNLSQFQRIFVIGAGKAVVPMLLALQKIIGKRITAGMVITKKGYTGPKDSLAGTRLSIVEACHPVPDQTNLDASFKLTSLVANPGPYDLVICLLSGGGSALLLKPSPGISLGDIQATTESLLSCGANIGELNTIRKHLDELKGGGLATKFYPAVVVSLIISDVVGDDLDKIASGPTVADPTTFQDACDIIHKYHLTDQIPPAICNHIQAGIANKIPETLKPGDPIFTHVHNIIIGGNKQAVLATEHAAMRFGIKTHILTTSLQGEASLVGKSLSDSVMSLLLPAIQRPICFLAGGETTVTIHGTGKGGRNQELALGSVERLAGDIPIVLVSLASDGGDGSTDAAGAVVTHHTRALGLSLGLDPQVFLDNNDSYHYFERLGDLIKTGPTLTNVNDLVFIFAL